MPKTLAGLRVQAPIQLSEHVPGSVEHCDGVEYGLAVDLDLRCGCRRHDGLLSAQGLPSRGIAPRTRQARAFSRSARKVLAGAISHDPSLLRPLDVVQGFLHPGCMSELEDLVTTAEAARRLGIS